MIGDTKARRICRRSDAERTLEVDKSLSSEGSLRVSSAFEVAVLLPVGVVLEVVVECASSSSDGFSAVRGVVTSVVTPLEPTERPSSLLSDTLVGRVDAARADESTVDIGDEAFSMPDVADRDSPEVLGNSSEGVIGVVCFSIDPPAFPLLLSGDLAGIMGIAICSISSVVSNSFWSSASASLSASSARASSSFAAFALSALEKPTGAFSLPFSFSLYISRNFISRCFSLDIAGDFGKVAGSDLTLFPEDDGLGTKLYGLDSGIGGGGGTLYIDRCESRDLGRVDVESLELGRPVPRPTRDERRPAGRVATADPLEEGGRRS